MTPLTLLNDGKCKEKNWGYPYPLKLHTFCFFKWRLPLAKTTTSTWGSGLLWTRQSILTVTCFSTPLCPYCWSIDISGGSDKGRRRVSLFCQLFTNINTYKECLHQQLPVLGGPHHYLLCKHILPHSETCSLLDLKINI